MKIVTRAICFDMWGTLMKGGDIKLWQELQEIFKSDGLPLKEFITIGEKSIMTRPISLREGLAVFASLLKPKVPIESIKKAFKLWWSYIETANPSEGAETVLKRIKQKGITIVILSNSDITSVEFVMKKFGWKKYFNKLFISAKQGFLKPDLKIFHIVQDYLKLPKKQIVMIDDSLNHGVIPARSFGWRALWFARGRPGSDFGRIDSLKEIVNML